MLVKNIVAITLITCAIIGGAVTAIVGGAMGLSGVAVVIHLIAG